MNEEKRERLNYNFRESHVSIKELRTRLMQVWCCRYDSNDGQKKTKMEKRNLSILFFRLIFLARSLVSCKKYSRIFPGFVRPSPVIMTRGDVSSRVRNRSPSATSEDSPSSLHSNHLYTISTMIFCLFSSPSSRATYFFSLARS